MAKQTFSVGQTLTAAQMTSLQQTAMLGGAASAKTASYTLVAADAGGAISMSNASATTITVNTGLFAAGDTVQITNLGAGVCTITAGTATVNTSASLALAQYESGTLDFTSTSAAIFIKGAGAAAAASTNYSIINSGGTTLASASTVTVSGISGKDKIVVFVENARCASSNITLRLNGNTGTVYQVFGLQTGYESNYSINAFSADYNYLTTSFPLQTTGGWAGYTLFTGTTITGANGSGVKMVQTNSGGFNNVQLTINNVDVGKQYQTTGYFNSSSTISSISIISSAGNFTQGSVYVYGSAV